MKDDTWNKDESRTKHGGLDHMKHSVSTPEGELNPTQKIKYIGYL